MKSPHFNAGLVLAFAAFLGMAAPGVALAQQKYALGMNAKVGQSWDFTNTLSSDMSIKASARDQVENSEASLTQKRVGTVTVREVASGVPTVITVAFGKESSSIMKLDGQDQTVPFPLAGQTVTLKRSADGGVTHDLKMDLDPATERELHQLMEFDTSMYPKQAVAIGDEWVPDAAKLKAQLQLAPEDKLDLKCKLLKVGSIRGVKTCNVSLAGSIASNQAGMLMAIKVAGVLQLDGGTGLPVESDVTLHVRLIGTRQAPGPDGQPVAMTVNGGGQIRMAGAATPKEGFGGAAVASGDNSVDADAPAPIPGGKSLDPSVVADGKPKDPIAGAEENPFAGSFKGKQLSADFKVDGNKVTGAIKLGDRSFPATGSIDNGRLTGAFKADGAEFDFVAAVEGQTLTLDSEGNKYTLQKEAAAAPATPGNPPE